VGRWLDAWALLSEYSQRVIGSVAAFEANETAYNDIGGSVFRIEAPTQDPDMEANFLGAAATQIAQQTDMSRGFLIFVIHPDVQAASAGTTGLYLAALSTGAWRVWLVH
jgi:hypothetical protein